MAEYVKTPETSLPPEDMDMRTATVSAMQVCEDAKRISPESREQIDARHHDYLQTIAEIHADRSELHPDEYKQTLKYVTKEYIDALRTITGVTEWSQKKLVEDGNDALKKKEASEQQDRDAWHSEFRSFQKELRNQTDALWKKQQEELTHRGKLARSAGNAELLSSRTDAPKNLKDGLSLAT